MNYATMQEASLWLAFKQSDARALSEIYERFVNELYNYGFHFVHDAAQVQDAIQDVFADLWRTRTHLSNTTAIKYYLFCCLRRRLSRNKAFGSRMTMWVADECVTESAEHVMIQVEESIQQLQRLQRAIERLPFRQQEVIRLRFYDDFSWAEIAGMLEINEQSVRNLLQRAVLKLRQLS
ncbi:RNA polymerase sigma-70 factor, ECF subfamily [Chitinophaga costaii]|uniref:RNA polymerase sigma-70 factor, ECF subfamily n=1 Tax=Chitinophaga costaii TaxID=1335309 RepID=A0A1C4DU17_9BACT|nr:sigma-70 family RNA polymerase sigma factor [Chitinophaga costaii]PUZ27788.1 sigma-70 family RNA polymerase sigma factor [Chitinophaga costaii]SCC34760.1 RNA polymerase sigma-70 factor, ECF subfamily [Chitinophaga costaii]